MPECLYKFYTEEYDQFHLKNYDKRWLPIGIKGRIESDSSIIAASSVTRLSSQTMTPEMMRSVEPESIV
jgi:hypothetical protein